MHNLKNIFLIVVGKTMCSKIITIAGLKASKIGPQGEIFNLCLHPVFFSLSDWAPVPVFKLVSQFARLLIFCFFSQPEGERTKDRGVKANTVSSCFECGRQNTNSNPLEYLDVLGVKYANAYLTVNHIRCHNYFPPRHGRRNCGTNEESRRSVAKRL